MIPQLLKASESLYDKVDAIVWPEYSLGVVDDSTFEMGREIASRAGLFVANGLENIDGEDRNTALVISAGGVEGRHVKNHPVHLFQDGVAGEKADPIPTHLGKIGTPVCFDCDHQDVVRRMTANGAEFFLVPSMDASHWSARQHEQHGALFRHRAAENGRWLAVASSSGVTQIIDSRGHVRDRIPLMIQGSLIGKVGLSNHLTPFQRGGWLIGPANLAITGAVGLWLFWKRTAKKNAPMANPPTH